MNFWLWLLVGFGSGLIIFPIFLSIFLLFKNTLERRRIKRLIKKGKFLSPLDVKDYDQKTWANQIKHDPEALKNLNKIFIKKVKDASPESANTAGEFKQLNANGG